MSTDKIAEMRRAMAARYQRAPEAERPKVRICDDCGKSVYDSKVCMATGRLHNLEATNLVGGLVADKDKKVFTGKELVSAIDAVRVKWQPARTTKVMIDGDAATIFQTFVLQHQWQMQRGGIMYGTVDPATQVVSVHAIYEPEQEMAATTFAFTDDPRLPRVDELARLLGLQRVGVIATHPPRDGNHIVLTARELLLGAKEQSRYGDHCVLLTVAPNPETQEIQAQAWQASEQCVHLLQIGLLSEHADDIRYVHSTQPLELAQEDVDAKGHKQCVIREPNQAVDARWMTAYCAVEAFASPVVSSKFIRISRPGSAPPDITNLRNYLHDPKRNRLPFVEQIADFHVLVFLMENVFDMRSDVPGIAAAVAARDSAHLTVYEELLKEHFRAVAA